MSMFCFQCEQTAGGKACRKRGVCGKDETTAKLQDLLVYLCKFISMFAHRARQLGKTDSEIDIFIMKALFSTVTNVNFDPETIDDLILQADELLDKAESIYEKACDQKGVEPEKIEAYEKWMLPQTQQGRLELADQIGIEERIKEIGAELTDLQELLTYGLKGSASYADHAYILGYEEDSIYAFFHEALNFLTTHDGRDMGKVLDMVLRAGQFNLEVMRLLDEAHNATFGSPQPTQVLVTPVKGKAILVSGHDLKDLEQLLIQTQGKGINIYTHGEMLPAHGYPQLKKYPHLIGNYGGAWQDQQFEFDEFPGAILMTTNCIQKPRNTYKDRIFTTGLVQWPDVKHLGQFRFGPLIERALELPGFDKDEPEKKITVGFGHEAVKSVAGQVVDAVKAGKIKHFFLIGGCDGAKPGRNYYTQFAEMVPQDCVILTLACGKYRFNKLDFGSIDGIPRLLDVGQCNDAFSAIQIATMLAQAFGCGVNDLPLSMILSWYEQKAVCILLTLLYLGIQNIKLGPTLPAFVGPEALKILIDKFNIAPVTDPKTDLQQILGQA